MNDKKFTFILYGKVQSITTFIKNHFNVTYKEALKMFYNSQVYEDLENEKLKMWYFSSTALFNMFLEEHETGKYTVNGV